MAAGTQSYTSPETGNFVTTGDGWCLVISMPGRTPCMLMRSWRGDHTAAADLAWRVAKFKYRGADTLRCISAVNQLGDREVWYTPDEYFAQGVYDGRVEKGCETYYETIRMKDGQRFLVAKTIP